MYKYKSPANRSPTTRAFVSLAKFIITKYLKQELDNDLSVSVDERSPCGLSRTGDIKIYQYQNVMTLPPTLEKGPMDFHQGVVFTAQN